MERDLLRSVIDFNLIRVMREARKRETKYSRAAMTGRIPLLMAKGNGIRTRRERILSFIHVHKHPICSIRSLSLSLTWILNSKLTFREKNSS